MIDIGFILQTLRKEYGYSQKYVAINLGVSTAVVSQWESSYIFPSKEKLIALADFYNVPLNYLTGLDTKKAVTVTGLPTEAKDLLQELISVLSDPNKTGLTPHKLELLGRISALFANTK